MTAIDGFAAHGRGRTPDARDRSIRLVLHEQRLPANDSEAFQAAPDAPGAVWPEPESHMRAWIARNVVLGDSPDNRDESAPEQPQVVLHDKGQRQTRLVPETPVAIGTAAREAALDRWEQELRLDVKNLALLRGVEQSALNRTDPPGRQRDLAAATIGQRSHATDRIPNGDRVTVVATVLARSVIGRFRTILPPEFPETVRDEELDAVTANLRSLPEPILKKLFLVLGAPLPAPTPDWRDALRAIQAGAEKLNE